MVKWFSKKTKKGDVSHFTDKKVEREFSPEDLSTSIDVLDEPMVPFNDDSHSENFADGNFRPEESEAIEDLSGKQRKEVEDYVGSPIVLSYDNHIDKPYFLFDNKQGWMVFTSEDEVNNTVKKKLEFNLKNHPEIFDQKWLDDFRMITMSEDEINKQSEIESKRFTEHAGKKELENLAHSFGIHVNVELPLDEYRKKIRSGIQRELKHQLQDPVEFYVNMEGRYTESELAEMPFVQTKLDVDGAVKNAIELNGRSHFLPSVDGREVKINDMYLYRVE